MPAIKSDHDETEGEYSLDWSFNSEYGEPIDKDEDGDGAMDDIQFASAVRAATQDAVDYIDGFIANDRALATKFYRGEPFGNEEEGRSQIVMTEVRDVVQQIIPSLLRIFTSSDKIVEFAPTNVNTVEQAKQATDYVNMVVYGDNPGFSIIHQAFKDALIRKTGIIKAYWSKDKTISEVSFTGIDQGQVAVLEQDESVTIVELTEQPLAETPIAPQLEPGEPPMPEMPPMQLYDIRIRRSVPKNRVVLEAIPPEEFLCARTSRDIPSSPFIGHRSYKTISALVAMGYDQEEIEAHAGGGSTFALNTELQTRNPAIMSFQNRGDGPDKSMQEVLYIEAFIRIDKDGDGFAELMKVCCLGEGHHVLDAEVCDEAPFAFFCPDPEPHMLIGQSIADQTMDLQLIKSNIVRNTLDSLAQVIHPRTTVVENMVNMDDVMNTEMGAVIRTKGVGVVQSLSEPFVGQQAMPILAYMDQVSAQRTGIVPASQGADANVLQSTTKDAVQASVQSAQERTELIARIFAENGMKSLMKIILRLIIRHQDKARTVKLRGKWVDVDPSSWDVELDVIVDVALGRGTVQERIAFLMLVAGKQEQIIMTLGPSNPMCSIEQLRNTYEQIILLSGVKDVDRYFKQIDPQQMQAMAAQPPKPDPAMALVQIEQKKLEDDVQFKQAKLQLDRDKMEREDAREKEKIRLDHVVALAEIQAKYQSKIDLTHIEGAISTDIALSQSAIGALSDAHGTTTQAGVDRHAAEIQAATDRHAALVAAATPQAPA